MDKKIFSLLFLIVTVAFFLRIYKVTEIPPSLNWDEVSIGYNAYSVLKTGRDEWGQFLPFFFKSYGEYKLPVQVYGSIPGIAIFGLNDFGVRITPVIYGTLTVFLIFCLTRKIFKNSVIALISAFLLAVSPWHIQLTRASFESSFALFWVVLGLWFFIKGFEKNIWWIISMIPFALAVYTYNSARFFVPAFLIFLAVLFREEALKSKKMVILSVTFFAVLLIPMVPFVISGEGSARYKLVSVADDPGLVPRINEQRGLSTLTQPLPRLIHNKYTYLTSSYISNYLAHFTPNFLFINGAPHKQHHVQNIGELYYFQAPFLLLGLLLVIKKQEKFRWLIIGWILIAYIPVSVTNDSIPHALRTLIAVPTYQFLSAYGIYFFYLWIKSKSEKMFVSGFMISFIVVLISMYPYLNNYYNTYPKLYSRDWQYGYHQVVDYIHANKDKYDLIIFSRHYGEPHMFTLFYENYDPFSFQNDPALNRFETYDWVRVLKFNKYYFPDLGDKGTKFEDIIKENPNKKMLFIGRKQDFPSSVPRVLTVDFLNGDRALDLVSTN